jgi:hypothetical protein
LTHGCPVELEIAPLRAIPPRSNLKIALPGLGAGIHDMPATELHAEEFVDGRVKPGQSGI